MPAAHKGDLGLEAFTRTGYAYQCYAAEEPLPHVNLYDRQRDKLTKDIGKFIRNASVLNGLLVNHPIKRWCLVVPRSTSAQLLVHAAGKATEVRNAGLAYVDPDFAIDIITHDLLAEEEAELAALGLSQIDVPHLGGQQDEVDAWEQDHSDLVQTLDTKIAKMAGIQTAQRAELRGALLRYYVRGENLIAHLRNEYPLLLGPVERRKLAHEDEVRLGAALHIGTPSDLVATTARALEDGLGNDLPGFSETSRKELAWSAVADWMLRCPLNFPDSHD